MKAKKAEKKLSLNKKTVACLDKKESNQIKGGIVIIAVSRNQTITGVCG